MPLIDLPSFDGFCGLFVPLGMRSSLGGDLTPLGKWSSFGGGALPVGDFSPDGVRSSFGAAFLISLAVLLGVAGFSALPLGSDFDFSLLLQPGSFGVDGR